MGVFLRFRSNIFLGAEHTERYLLWCSLLPTTNIWIINQMKVTSVPALPIAGHYSLSILSSNVLRSEPRGMNERTNE